VIKSSYRRMPAKWHPDTCQKNKDECAEMTRKIISAYQMINDYCAHYQYSFTENTVRKHRRPEERLCILRCERLHLYFATYKIQPRKTLSVEIGGAYSKEHARKVIKTSMEY